MSERSLRAVLSHELGGEVLRQAASALRRGGLVVMPLKGIWLQSLVYERPEQRAITDVDLLAPEGSLSQAIHLLEQAGFVARQRNTSEVALYKAGLPLPVDLHAQLFMPGAFNLPTRALFRRAVGQGELQGANVVLPDPNDAFCHLLGHFVKSRGAPDETERTRDLVLTLDRFALDPKSLAARVHEAGMGRAARYALRDVARTDLRAHQVLRALAPDPIGEIIAHTCAAAARGRQGAVPSHSLRRIARALPGLLLERSVGHAAKATLMRAWAMAKDEPARPDASREGRS